MITTSYTLSSTLEKALQKINILRRDMLLMVLSPADELRFRWHAQIERIFWSLSFSDTQLSKNDLVKLFSGSPKKRLNSAEKKAVDYKKAFDYINQEWIGSQKPVSAKTAIILHALACSGRLRISQESLKQSFMYFQSSNEHPVIQAGLIKFQILALSPFTDGNSRLSNLMAYLFLYKEGFDCRGLLVLEKYFKHTFNDYQEVLNIAKTGTQTLWLEYFVNGVAFMLEKALEDIKKKKNLDMSPVIFKLNERQKEILAILENPDITITNRQVQKIFHISQITASRDLAKLASLGLLFTHGMGRSVSYTKI